jgi:hypothetical protein
VDVSNGFQALKDFDAEWKLVVLGKLLEILSKFQPKLSPGYYELKKHKPWFNEGYSKLLDQRKQAKLQWLQEQWVKLPI